MTTVSGHTPLRLTGAAAGAAATTALGDGTIDAAAAADGEAAGLAAGGGEAAGDPAAAADGAAGAATVGLAAAGAAVVGVGVGAAEVQPAAMTMSARTGSVELFLNQRERCMQNPFSEIFATRCMDHSVER
jgi:hypothetical protein